MIPADPDQERAAALAGLLGKIADPRQRARAAEELLTALESLYNRAGVEPPPWIACLRSGR